MRENSFQKKVVKELRQLGCLVIKNKADVSTGRGIPDLTVFIGDKYVCFVELKTDTGKLSDEQKQVINYIKVQDFAQVNIISPKNYKEFKDEVIRLRFQSQFGDIYEQSNE